MRALVLFSALCAAASAIYAPYTPYAARGFSYGYSAAAPLYGAYARSYPYAGALGYAAYAAPAPVAVAATTSTQHHSQDEFGQYNYGYADVNSAKTETKTADGVVRGSYSYRDSYGIPQKVDYVSDALGFRVAATNLPVAPAPVTAVHAAPVAAVHTAVPAVAAVRAHPVAVAAPVLAGPAKTPAVLAAEAQHFAAHAEARLRHKRSLPLSYAAPLSLPYARAYASPARFGYAYSSLNPTYGYARTIAAPYAVAAHPVAVAAPATTSTQHHSQDEFGQYNYGYADVNSAKTETKTADGVVRGSYSYRDSYGIPQKVDYVADALGFRTAATNLPVAPAPVAAVHAAPVAAVAPVPAVAAVRAAVPVAAVHAPVAVAAPVLAGPAKTPSVLAAEAAHFAAHAEARARLY